MKLGTKGRYAVMALVDLAAQDREKPTNLSDVALRQNLSISYLEQLFARLRKAGLVESVRGQAGGYFMSKEPAQVTISDIFQAVGEPIKTTACKAGGSSGCAGSSIRCSTHDLWAGLSDVMHNYLNDVSLADICTRPKNLIRNQAA